MWNVEIEKLTTDLYKVTIWYREYAEGVVMHSFIAEGSREDAETDGNRIADVLAGSR